MVTHFAKWLLYILSDDCVWIIMSPPTKNTYWLVITTFFLVPTSSYFTSSSLELSFLSLRVVFGNFSDYSPLVLICISVFFIFFNSLSFFFLAIFFLIDKRSISVADLLFTATAFLLSFFCFFLINNCVQKCYMSADPGSEVDVGTALEDMKLSRKTRKSLLPRPNPPKNGTNV